jgi:hypothetical protein
MIKSLLTGLTNIQADDLDDDQFFFPGQLLDGLVHGPVCFAGKRIQVTVVSSRWVGFLLRKFLYVTDVSGYGVLDTGGRFQGLFTSSPRQERKKGA